jgi:hypothetical protein
MKHLLHKKPLSINILFITFFFLYCQNPATTQPQLYPDFIDENINSALTDYFENDTTIPDGVKPFVFFQYYKLVHDSADHYRAMIRLYTNSIYIKYQQVFDFRIVFRPALYVVHIRKDKQTLRSTSGN